MKIANDNGVRNTARERALAALLRWAIREMCSGRWTWR